MKMLDEQHARVIFSIIVVLHLYLYTIRSTLLDTFVELDVVESLKRVKMYGYEPRDRSGPMDIDEQDPMARVAQFALPHPEEGPSRKREYLIVCVYYLHNVEFEARSS